MVFFKTFEMDFEVRRLLWYCPYGGSDFAEVEATCSRIKERNYESWYQEWQRTAEMLLSRDYRSPISRGKALLRASRYFQEAEFFLDPKDARKLKAYELSVKTFYQGLGLLGVDYDLRMVPFGPVELRTLYFRTKGKSKGTLFVCGGFDALLEELYFTNAGAALDEGYDVVLFEGPGQSHVIRYEKTPFTKDWDQVLEAVLAAYQGDMTLPKIGVGLSLGGLLMARASGLRPELLDSLVLYNYFPNILDSFKTNIPALLHGWVDRSFPSLAEKLVSFYIARQPFLNWQVEHAKWTFGADSLNDLLTCCREFEEDPVQIPVLVCLAANDNYYPYQLGLDYVKRLENPYNKLLLFDQEEHFSDLHCQNGAAYETNDAIFDWLEQFTPHLQNKGD